MEKHSTMNIGIDEMRFATTPFYLSMTDLANARGVDPNKYLIGIGQEKQAVVPPTQDIVTLATQAASKLPKDKLERVKTVILATESGIDNSKASAVYVKHLLKMTDDVRVVEIKEACYAATAGLQFAKGLVALEPQSYVLVIAADIARYGLQTPGEVTQGAGAVAMLVSADPHVMTIEPGAVSYSQDLMDFWRPLYATEALVDGKYSTNVYIDFFNHTYRQFIQQNGLSLDDFNALIFHLPFTKMGKKALESLLADRDDNVATHLRHQLQAEQVNCRLVGNLYTGSLYLGLMSLIEHGQLMTGDRIGLFSYGSGAEGEFYTGILQPDFKDHVEDIAPMLEQRTQVSIPEYEGMFNGQLGMNDEDIEFDLTRDPSRFLLTGQKNHQRQYIDREQQE